MIDALFFILFLRQQQYVVLVTPPLLWPPLWWHMWGAVLAVERATISWNIGEQNY